MGHRRRAFPSVPPIRNRFAVERSTEGLKSSLRRRDRPRRSRCRLPAGRRRLPVAQFAGADRPNELSWTSVALFSRINCRSLAVSQVRGTPRSPSRCPSEQKKNGFICAANDLTKSSNSRRRRLMASTPYFTGLNSFCRPDGGFYRRRNAGGFGVDCRRIPVCKFTKKLAATVYLKPATFVSSNYAKNCFYFDVPSVQLARRRKVFLSRRSRQRERLSA